MIIGDRSAKTFDPGLLGFGFQPTQFGCLSGGGGPPFFSGHGSRSDQFGQSVHGVFPVHLLAAEALGLDDDGALAGNPAVMHME